MIFVKDNRIVLIIIITAGGCLLCARLSAGRVFRETLLSVPNSKVLFPILHGGPSLVIITGVQTKLYPCCSQRSEAKDGPWQNRDTGLPASFFGHLGLTPDTS